MTIRIPTIAASALTFTSRVSQPPVTLGTEICSPRLVQVLCWFLVLFL